MALHLKTIKGSIADGKQRYALLLDPDVEGEVHSDKELYKAVNEHGSATIILFQENKPAELEMEPIRLSSRNFEKEWRGD